MTTIEVKFTDEEKKFLCNCIEAVAHEEPKCKEVNGYDFSITEEQLPDLRHMSLDVTIVLISDNNEATYFDYKLIDGNCEVKTNLDPNFEDMGYKAIECE